MPKERLLYIDLIKFVAIFCVIWGHCIQYLSNDINFLENIVFKFIYSFHMPLFMAISGFFFNSCLKLSFLQLIKKKFYQLILPCISWSLIYTIIQLDLNSLAIRVINDFWYLKSLFICYIIGYTSVKIFKKEWIAYLISIILVICTPYITNKYHTHTMYPFFCIGILINKYRNIIFKYHKLLIGVSSLCFISMLFFWKGEYTMYISPFCPIQYSKLELSFSNLWIAIFRFFIGLSGVFLFLLVCKSVSDKFKSNKHLIKFSEIGKYTMGIYILQFYIVESYRLIPFISEGNPIFFNLIFTPGISCVCVIRLIQKNKMLNFILLGIRK